VINKKQNLDTMWDCAEDSEELINTWDVKFSRKLFLPNCWWIHIPL
jgi:hypothetical protein